MPIEQFKNGAASTLSGNSGGVIDALVTSFNVANGALFPTNGVFRVLVGTELMIIGSRAANTLLSVTRGAEGTTAATHTDGDAVTCIVTAEALKNLATPTRTVLTPPPVVGWSWDNQGGSSITDDGDSQVLVSDSVSNIPSLTGRYRTAPAPPYKITAMMFVSLVHKAYVGYGLFFRQSSDGKLHGNMVLAVDLGLSVFDLRSTKWPSATGLAIDYQATKSGHVLWFRIEDNGTNRICWISADGLYFLPIHTIARTDYLTADQVGFYVSKQNLAAPNFGVILRLMSWAVD